ncbi:MAG: CoB--CoM heterodisulfide reductase iron-sulfur subunit B family protein [Caldisericia bacterium]|nr:CoB--CoM heterodisulfide reductase iron-sulfur subunit B family protein [Caldisericia bacterium]MDD5689353.1 CoB--CoM heterodisulfide reductase iron-sulfur subunit B family protein [Caldisericia bacterium]
MTMDYAYYPGCSLESTSPDFNISTNALIKFLDLGIDEIPDWTCCGASALHPQDKLLSVALPALTIESANKIKKDIMVQCPACLAHLKESRNVISEGGELAEQLSKILEGHDISPNINIKHFSEILLNEYGLGNLQDKVVRKLNGLKVVCYYGCVIVRPKKLMQYDDPENPTIMDKLISITGADVLDWPFKTRCCGASYSISRVDVVYDLTYEILSMAKKVEANAISVLCPLCHVNLDLRQKAIEQRYGEKFNLPVFYYTQLLGLSFGIDPKELALDRLFVSPFPLLESNNLI